MKNELDRPHLLNRISSFAQSERAKKACLAIDTFETPQRAQESASNVLYAIQLSDSDSVPSLTVIDAVPMILERLQIQAVLDIKELVLLRQFINTTLFLKQTLKGIKNPWTTSLNGKIADLKSQVSAIDHVVSNDGEINEHASATLQSLCDERRRLNREITKTLDTIVARRQMENLLQDRYVTNREGRMVIPVKSGSQHDVKGLIHDASQSKQTVFMEPEEVIPLNNRLREVQIQIQEEIYRILKELSEYLARSTGSFANADSALLDCDTFLAKAKLSKNIKASQARFVQNASFSLKDLRHPLLVLQGVEVVSNTVILKPEQRILLLSGPNAGGKTVLLKSIGLAAQMARSGLPIAASEGSEIPFFESLDPIVGDLQSVGENLSSFSSHVARLTNALKHRGLNSLILVDEICGTTDPEEGAALARSFIENFAEQKVFSIVTSHLGPLKENWAKEFPIMHGSLEFDSKTNRPTYQLLIGFPGRSLALSMAERLGVPKNVVDRARSYLSPESRDHRKNLEEMEDLKSQIFELKTQAQSDRQEARAEKEKYLGLVNKFREQRDKWLEQAIKKGEKKIENLIEDARTDRLKNKTLHDLKGELPTIVKARSGTPRIRTLEEFKAELKPGTPAFLARLGRQVVVQSEPDQKGQVTVLADSMRLQVPWHSLAPVGEKSDSPSQTVIRNPSRRVSSSASSTVVPDDATSELDLRGRRSDEALTLLEKFLDASMLEQKDVVKVVHGFGTEQLKKAIRQFLSKSRYVKKWNPGDSTTGGDGVTWIYLAD